MITKTGHFGMRKPLAFSFLRSLKGKLIASFLIFSLIPLMITGLLAFFQAQNSLREQAFAKLVAVRSLKVKQIGEYFRGVDQDIRFVTKFPEVVEAAYNFRFAVSRNTLETIRDMGFLDTPDLVMEDD